MEQLVGEAGVLRLSNETLIYTVEQQRRRCYRLSTKLSPIAHPIGNPTSGPPGGQVRVREQRRVQVHLRYGRSDQEVTRPALHLVGDGQGVLDDGHVAVFLPGDVQDYRPDAKLHERPAPRL